jgi:magnesium transporter
LYETKKRGSDLDYQISSKKSMLRYLIKTPTDKISKLVKQYLRDILEEAVTVVKEVDFINDKIDDLTKTFLTRMTLTSYRVNINQEELMKRFGVISVLFTPLIFVSTLFGMNIRIPGEKMNNYVFFSLLYVGAILFLVIGTLWFKVRKWI